MKSKLTILLLLFGIISTFSIKSFAATQQKKTVLKKDTNVSYKYIPPQRMILLSPYVSFIYANDLYTGAIKDQSKFGGGINIRTQLYENFGFILDAMYTNLEIIENYESQSDSELVAIFTGGFYYSLYYFSFADMRIDMSYGAITAGENVMTIFIPGVEFYKSVAKRVIIFAKLGYLITNDWIVDYKYKENYKSFSVSAGLSVIF